jgi:hypothetical protein
LTQKFEAKIADLERRLLSSTGKIPQVKAWSQEAVAYEGELFGHQGSLWQARRTTGQPPGGPHWVMITRCGRDGRDVSARGEWLKSDAYGPLDTVAYRGCSYICARANPGVPGQCDD